MKPGTALKLGQIAGVLVLCIWAIAYAATKNPNTLLLLLGAGIYAGCRLALWLRKSD